MLKNTCCIICLSINIRTINIYDTDLQCVYENLANFKIRDNECWMCYICHTRLRQCQQLQQLAVQTRGLIDDIIQNKIYIKLEAFGSLLKLSTSRMKVTSTTLPNTDLETDGTVEIHYEDSALQQEKKTTDMTAISTSTPPLYIKQEVEVKMEFCSDNEIEQDEFGENVYEVETKSLNISKDALPHIKQELLNVDYIDAQGGASVQELNIAKFRQIGSDQNCKQPSTRSVTEVRLEDWGDGTVRGHSKGKVEIKDEGVNRDEGGNRGGEDQSVCQKRPLSCDVCLKSFPWESDLRAHVRQHTGEKPFSCGTCSKKFTRKSSLNIHMQTHTGVKSFGCGVCSKKFTQKSHLNVHVRTHTDSKPFGCELCPRKFLLKSNLNSHILTHTGEKPFDCDSCSKSFSRRSDLNVHKRIHLGYKPFGCDVCSKKFSQKSHLTGHVLTHRDGK